MSLGSFPMGKTRRGDGAWGGGGGPGSVPACSDPHACLCPCSTNSKLHRLLNVPSK